MLGAELGATGFARLCQWCGSAAHGQPLVRIAEGDPPSVSLSYADGLVAVAWGRSGPVGIDVEPAGPPLEGIDRQEWTVVEAAFKAGSGGATPLSDLPPGYVGAVAGDDVSWRLAGPAAPAR